MLFLSSIIFLMLYAPKKSSINHREAFLDIMNRHFIVFFPSSITFLTLYAPKY